MWRVATLIVARMEGPDDESMEWRRTVVGVSKISFVRGVCGGAFGDGSGRGGVGTAAGD